MGLPAVLTISVCLLAVWPGRVLAQANPEAQLTVTVTDETGGGIPQASVRLLLRDGSSQDVTTDSRGVALASGLPAGPVRLRVEMAGFAVHESAVLLRRGGNTQDVTLQLAGLEEEVVVTDMTTADDRRGNSTSTVLGEDELAALSDDPEELAAQLEAMTGGAGAVFQVDGFRDATLPNRSDIRQVRFRNNSFAADNHDARRAQVDIVTRPGLTEWSGNANLGLRSDILNARNAFARAEAPERFRRFNMGVRGPVVRNRTSVRLSVDGNRSFDSGTVFALTPDGRVADQVRRPYEQTNVSLGFDHGLTRDSALRLEYRAGGDDRRNLGVGDFSLPERAYRRSSTEQRVRGSIQSVFGPAKLNELRVQASMRESLSESANTGVSIVVIDAFSRGGAGVSSRGTTRALEITDNFDFTVGRHAMRIGTLLEAAHYRNFDARNAAGTFTFGSLAAFDAGLPNTFTQRLGQVNTGFTQYQLGVYWQDDVRLHPSLTVSAGLRQELQNHVGDKVNLMPRLGFTWNAFESKTVVRGGYGIFHDWYDSNLHDQTLRVDGRTQRDLLVLNPGYPDPIGGVAAIVLPGGRVQAVSTLVLPFVHQASVSLTRPITEALYVTAAYTVIRGRNQLRSVNVNAPGPSGVRPEPGTGTVTQIESTGRSANDRLNLHVQYQARTSGIFASANYTFAHVKSMGDSPLSLPANSLDPDAEWAPASQDIRHRLNAMVSLPIWLGVWASVTTNASSAAPYNITTGRDDNSDGVSNDRPAGVGRNSERGASRWDLSARVTRAFGFGGARTGRVGRRSARGRPNDRFGVELYVQAFNLLNRTNYVNFSGNLQSPFFGVPTSAAQPRRMEVGMQFRF
jgi:hypothetical protein